MCGLQAALLTSKTGTSYWMCIKTSSEDLARIKSGRDCQWILLRSEWPK